VPKPEINDPLVKRLDAIEELAISPATFDRRVKDGTIPVVRVGGPKVLRSVLERIKQEGIAA